MAPFRSTCPRTAGHAPSPARRAVATALALAAGVALAAVAPLARADEVKVALSAQAGKPVGGIKVVKLKRDDPVTIEIVSDRADEVHVHGYDLKLKLEPNKAATLQFTAKRTGRFAIELHKSGAEIGVLEIYPK